MKALDRTIDLEVIIQLIGHHFEVVGKQINYVDNVAPINESNARSLSWASSTTEDLDSLIRSSQASVIICPNTSHPVSCSGYQTLLLVDDPRLTFARILRGLFGLPAKNEVPINPTAVVSQGAVLGADVTIGAYAVVGSCKVGAGTYIGSHSVIYDEVSIGEGVLISNHCTIGGPGFGYARNSQGTLERFPQIGTTIIEDAVEIFPFTNVDRGALGVTRVGMGSKINRFCHIAHNSEIGSNTMLASGVHLLGGAKVGNSCIIGAGAVIRGDVNIGDGAVVGMGSNVLQDVTSGTTVVGNPSRERPRYS